MSGKKGGNRSSIFYRSSFCLLLLTLLLAPLAALLGAERAPLVREPRVVIPDGENDRRHFIGPGMLVLKNGSLLTTASWGRALALMGARPRLFCTREDGRNDDLKDGRAELQNLATRQPGKP